MNKSLNELELFREYDGLVNLTLINLYSMSKELGVIRLFDFDPKNKEHLFVLRVAIIARDIYQFPIEVGVNWWNGVKLNRKVSRIFDKVGRIGPNECRGIWVGKMLDFMRPDGINHIGEDFSFADIYEAYYEGSLN